MKLGVLILLCLCGALSSLAQTTWNGSTSTDWNTATNWSTGIVPTSGTDVVIPKVTNFPTIGAGITATAKSVEVQIDGALTIAATGSLTIYGSRSIAAFSTAFSNKGTVNNNGQLVIGSVASAGDYGMRNQWIFNNKGGGIIQIDRSTVAGLYNGFVASFTNEASLVIGATSAVGEQGLLNEGNFFNSLGGSIQINRSSKAGLYNDFANFTNDATLEIGNVASVGENGLLNEGDFFNNPGANILIDRSTTTGLYNGFVAILTNKSDLKLGPNGSVGDYGLANKATLLNSGLIQIDRSTQYGLGNEMNTLGISLEPSVNRGNISIGSIGAVGSFGLANHAPFLNSGCATFSLFAALNNTASFANEGLFKLNTVLPHTNVELINNGILEYAQINPIPNVTNNDLIVGPIVASCNLTVTPALQIAASNRFVVGGTWYHESALTTVAGTYSSNTFTATSLTPGSTSPLSFTVSDPANNCVRTITVPVSVEAPSQMVSLTASGPLSCLATSVVLTATPGFTNYRFSSGVSQTDGPTSNTGIVSSSGVYSVTATDNSGCTTTASLTVEGSTQPPLNLIASGPISTAPNFTVTLTATPGFTSYSFSAGASQPDGPTSNTAAVTSAGTYSVTATSAGDCWSTASVVVSDTIEIPPLIVSVSPNQLVGCVGQAGSLSVTASGGIAPYSYSWSAPEGVLLSSSSSNVVSYSLTSAGINSLTVVVSSAGGGPVSTATVSVTASALPTASISASPSLTASSGQSTTLTASGGESYQWSTGASGASIVVSTAGTYSVTATSSGGCTATTHATVTTMTVPPLVVSVSPNQLVGCVGQTGSLSVTASGGSAPYSYSWNAPEGVLLSSTNSNVVSYSLTGAGVNSLTVVVSSAGGGPVSTATVSVTASALPTASISASPSLTISSGQSTTLTASGGNSYRWSTGSTNASIPVSTAGTYSVTATNSSGCWSTSSVIVTTNSAPPLIVSVSPSKVVGCAGLTGTLVASASGGIPPYTYSWVAPEGVILNSTTTSTVSGTVTTAGVKSLTVVVRSSGGGPVNTGIVSITANALPSVTISANPSLTISSGQSTTLTASGGNTYRWSTGATSPSIPVSTTGTYSVTATSSGGCTATTNATVTTMTVPPLVVSVSPGQVVGCVGQAGSLSVTASGGSAPYSYSWSAPEGVLLSSTSSSVVSYSLTSAGINSLTVVVSSAGGGPVSTATVSVTANALPTASISASPSLTISSGQSTTLTASGGESYQWSTGASGASIVVSTAGTYSVTATSSGGCTATTNATVTTMTVPPLVVSVSPGQVVGCVGQAGSLSVTASGGSAPYSYSWSAPEGVLLGSTSSSVVSYSLTSAGINSLTVVVSSAGGGPVSTATVSVTANALPTASISASPSLTISSGQSTTLTASGGESYQWSTGASGASIVVSTAGTYSVTATSSGGCTATTHATVTTMTVPPLVVSVSPGQVVGCVGQTGSLSVTASGGSASYSYSWSAPEGVLLSSNSSNVVSYSLTSAGINSLTVVVSSAGGGPVSTATVSVTANALPTASISASPSLTVSSGQSTTLTASGGESYQWSTGASGASFVVSTAGTYSVTATNGGGCWSPASVVVSEGVVIAPLVVSVSPNQLVGCVGQTGSLSVTASGGSAPYSYSWSAPEGVLLSSSSSNVVSYSLTSAGINSLTVVVSSAGGGPVSTATVSVTANALPTASISASPSLTVSSGQSTTLTASGGESYQWSTGASGASFVVSTAGTYSVTATNGGGCWSPASVVVSEGVVIAPLVVSVSPNQLVGCVGQTGSLSVTASGGSAPYSYSWSAPEGVLLSSSSSNVVSYSLTSAGINSLTVVVSSAGGGPVSTATVSVTANALPTASISASPSLTVSSGQSTTLTASGGESYQWSTGASGASIVVSTAGTYSVTATNGGGCWSPASVVVSEGVVIAPLVVSVSPNQVVGCVGQAGSLSAVASGGIAPYSYSWSAPEGVLLGSTNSSVVSYSLTSAGGNSLTVVVRSAGGGPVSTATVSVTASALPTASISASPSLMISSGQSTTLTASGGESYQWSTGASGASIVVSTAGTYSVTATNGGGCWSPASVEVSEGVVIAPLVVSVSPGQVVGCVGQTGSLSVTASGGIAPYSYSWSAPEGVLLGSTNSSVVSYSLTGAGVNSLTVVVRSAGGGPVSTATVSVTASVLPTASISASPSLMISSGQSTTLTASGGESYQWSTGASGASIVVSTAGTYSVTATNGGGCWSPASVEVSEGVVIAPLVVSVSPGQVVGCVGQTGSLSVTASGGIAPYSYSWSAPEGVLLGSTNSSVVSYSLTGAGVNSLTVVVSSAGGGPVSTATVSVTASVLPTASISASPSLIISSGQSTTLTANGGGTYRWSTGATSASIPVSTSGVYSVTAVNDGGCSATTSVTVSVVPPLVVSVNPSKVVGCVGLTGTLVASASGGIPPYTYSWVAPEGVILNSTTTSTVSGTVTTAGVKSLTVVVSSSGGGPVSTAIVSVTANALPNVTISANPSLTISSGQSTTLTASGGNTYRWSTGATSPSIPVSTTGTYSVTATSSGGCTATANATVTTMTVPPLVVSVSPNQLVGCVGQTGSLSVTASGGSAPYSYSWSAPEGVLLGSTNSNVVSYSLTGAGVNSLTVVVSSAGGGPVSTATVSVTANALPTASISASPSLTVCADESATLTASGGSSYVWSTGATSAAISGNTSGVYSVTVVNEGGCWSTSSVTLYRNSAPTASISASPSLTISSGQSTTLTASGGNSYRWSTGSTNASIPVSTAGTYSVTAISSGGCTATTNVTVTTMTVPPLVVSVSPNQLVGCVGQSGSLSVTASGGSAPYSYSWSAPEGVLLGSTNSSVVSYSLMGAGVNSLTVVVSSAGGGPVSTATVSVTANALPTASISASPSLTISSGQSTTLTASGGESYQWSTGASGASIVVSTAGTYSVTATNGGGCWSPASVVVSEGVVIAPLVVSVSPNQLVGCVGQTGSLSVTASGGSAPYSYSWSAPEGVLLGSTNSSVVSYSLTGAGVNSLTVVVSSAGGGPVSTATVSVTASALPTASISASPSLTISSGQSTTLTASGGNSYRWSTGSTNASIPVSTTGTYSVTATSSGGCTATTNATVTTMTVPPLVVSVSPNQLVGCVGQSGSLSVTASGGSAPYSYSWSAPEGVLLGSTNSSVVSYSLTGAGINSLTVVVSSAGGGPVSTATVSVTANALPTASISASPSLMISSGQSTTLTASGGESYQWSTGASGASIVVSTAGTYSVTATSSGGCTATTNATVTTMTVPPLVVSVSPGQVVGCVGQSGSLSVTASGGSAPYSYSWRAPEGVLLSSTSSNVVSYSLTGAGINSLTVVVSSAGGGPVSTATVSVTANALPTASISASPSLMISSGQSTTLTASGGESYQWSTGASGASIVVSTAGTYSVTATSSGGCTATTHATVTTMTVPPLVVSVSPNQLVGCVGQTGSLSVTASGGSAPYSYSWNAPEGVLLSSTNSNVVSYSLTGAGVNSLTVVVSSAGGGPVSTATVSVTASALPTASISASPSLTISSGQSTTLTASGGNSYRWSTGSTNASIPVSTAGTYSVTATNSSGCWSTSSVIVTTNSAPPLIVSVNPSKVVGCAGLTGTLVASASGGTPPYSYSWTAPEGVILKNTNSNVVSGTVTTAGVKTITVTVSSAGGGPVNTATVSVTANALPNVIISANPSLSISEGQSTTLTASGGNTYRWSTGATSPSIPVSTTGTYSVTATSSAGCTATTSAVVSPKTGSNSRKATENLTTPLLVHVMGNPVLKEQLSVEVSGANGQSLYYELIDVKGGLVKEQLVNEAGTTDRQTFDLKGHPAQVFILRIRTKAQSQTIKIIKGE